MSILQKERKFIECFKSEYDRSCRYCNIRSWKKGYKIYGMKKPDGTWIACTDRQCYLEQGGKLTLFESSSTAPPSLTCLLPDMLSVDHTNQEITDTVNMIIQAVKEIQDEIIKERAK